VALDLREHRRFLALRAQLHAIEEQQRGDD
jgi:hypothetical protein